MRETGSGCVYSGKPGKVEGLSIRGRYGSGIGLLQEKSLSSSGTPQEQAMPVASCMH